MNHSKPYPFFHAVMPRLSRHRVPDVIVIDDEANSIRDSGSQRASWRASLLPVRKPWTIWSAAAVATVLMHVMFVGTLVIGTGKRANRPPQNEGFQSAGRNSDAKDSVSILFFVNDKSIRVPEEGNESTFTVSEAQQKTIVAALIASADLGMASEPPTLDDFDKSAAQTQDASGDGGEAARLFGIYMGQIKARIERTWNQEVFAARLGQCRVKIRQSAKGEVLNITVQRCDLDLESQMSLVRAIQASSPLSAPPTEKIFTEVVTLSFTASPQLAISTSSNNDLNARRTVRLH